MQPAQEFARQNNMPIKFTSEFQMYSNNSVHLNNAFYVTPLSSANNNHCSSSLVATNYLPLTSETTSRLNLSGQNQVNNYNIKTTGYITEKLPEATASNSQQYETNFDADVPLSVEESGKNTRTIYKEKGVQLSHKPTPKGSVVQRACSVHHREQLM